MVWMVIGNMLFVWLIILWKFIKRPTKKENNIEAYFASQGDDDEASPANKYNAIEVKLAYNNDDFEILSNITRLKAEDI